MTIYFIRHLPTNWNIKGKLQGHNDIAISKVSKKNLLLIKENIKLLNPILIDSILISELKRTKQTAEQYNIFSYDKEPLLNELNFGSFEGKLKTEMLQEIGDDWFFKASNILLGESLINFEKRLRLFIEKYSKQNTILIFGHGAVCRALIALSKYDSIDFMNKVEVENNKLVKIIFK